MAENMQGKSLNMAENMQHAHRSLGEGGGKPLTSAVIIVASGSGQRAGFDKLLADLNGHPVLEWSIAAFDSSPLIDEIILVCPEDRFSQLNLSSIKTPLIRVDGGSERHLSVAKGLQALRNSPEITAVHDGARPLIHPDQINELLLAAQSHRAAALAHPITETIKRTNQNQEVIESVNRDQLWAMETPQAFQTKLLLEAYQRVTTDNLLVTDEVSALEHLGIKTTLIPNTIPNLKITYPQDLRTAKAILG